MIFVGRPSDVRILSGEGSVSSSQFNLSWTVSGFAPVTDSHIEARKAVGSESTLGGEEVTTEKLGRGQGRCFYKSIFKNELKKILEVVFSVLGYFPSATSPITTSPRQLSQQQLPRKPKSPTTISQSLISRTVNFPNNNFPYAVKTTISPCSEILNISAFNIVLMNFLNNKWG